LYQERPQLGTKLSNNRQEIVQQTPGIAEPLHMGDVAWYTGAEDEVVRGTTAPRQYHLPRWYGKERMLDFNCGEVLGVRGKIL
jgi:hypothetical protein